MKRSGGCACGAIRFETTGDFVSTGACHCTDCQAAAGGGANYMALVPADGFSQTKGKPASYAVTADSGNKTERFYCPECGSPLWSRVAAPVVAVKFGAFDENSGLSIEWHMFTSSAPSWHPMPEDVPKFEHMPPMG